MPSLRELNQNTFFSVAEIPDEMDDTESALHLIYGDGKYTISRYQKSTIASSYLVHLTIYFSLYTADSTEDLILSDDVSCEELEKVRFFSDLSTNAFSI